MKHWLIDLYRADLGVFLAACWAAVVSSCLFALGLVSMSLSYANVALLILACWVLVVCFIVACKRSAKPVHSRVRCTASTFCRNQQGRPYERA